MIKKISILVFSISLFINHYAFSDEPVESTRDSFYIATVPKSGTNLVMRLCEVLGISCKQYNGKGPHLSSYVYPNLPKKKKRLLKKVFPSDREDPISKTFRNENKYVVTFRDMRDFFVSYIQWVDLEKDRKTNDEWRNLSFNEKLHYAITCTSPQNCGNFTMFQWHIDNYHFALELKRREYPNVLFLRFEDLIGPELGGNSKESQILAVKKLCKFCNFEASREEIENAVNQLTSFSNPNQVRTYVKQKKVHRWVDFFDDSNIQEFDKRYTSMLIELGYEDNVNWANLL